MWLSTHSNDWKTETQTKRDSVRTKFNVNWVLGRSNEQTNRIRWNFNAVISNILRENEIIVYLCTCETCEEFHFIQNTSTSTPILIKPTEHPVNRWFAHTFLFVNVKRNWKEKFLFSSSQLKVIWKVRDCVLISYSTISRLLAAKATQITHIPKHHPTTKCLR